MVRIEGTAADEGPTVLFRPAMPHTHDDLAHLGAEVLARRPPPPWGPPRRASRDRGVDREHLGLPTRASQRRRPWRPPRQLALERTHDAHEGVDPPSGFE